MLMEELSNGKLVRPILELSMQGFTKLVVPCLEVQPRRPPTLRLTMIVLVDLTGVAEDNWFQDGTFDNG